MRPAPSVLVLLALLACGAEPTAPIPAPHARTTLPPLASGTLAFVGVHVVPMTGPEVLADRTVIVRDGIIAEIGPSASVEVPADAERIDGRGRFLAPGLMDMHTHLRRHEVEATLRAGITTVRNMWGTPNVEALRQEAAAGGALPAIFSAGPGIDGDPPIWPGSAVATTPEQGVAAVRRQDTEGWDFIKVYNRLEPDVYDAILAEAGRRKITVLGHVPLAVDVHRALRGGHASIEHLTGIGEAVAGGRAPAAWVSMDGGTVQPLARDLAARGVWASPTQAVLLHLARTTLRGEDVDRARANQAAVVRALHEAGVPLLAGTDAGIDVVPAGTTLAEELRLFVDAGLTPWEALRTATTEAARFLGIADRVGTVEVGKRADLLLLRGDPLQDIAAVRGPLVVVLRGARLSFGEAPPATGGGPVGPVGH